MAKSDETLRIVPGNTKPVYCHQTKKIYMTAVLAGAALGINHTLVSRVLGGKAKAIRGYSFRLCTEAELRQLGWCWGDDRKL